MQPESPAKKPRRNWHLLRWAFLLIALSFGWGAWKAYDFRKAVKEAKELGWNFTYSDPFAIIRENWKAAFRKETWRVTERKLYIQQSKQLEPHFDVIRRLEPNELASVAPFPMRDLSELRGMSDLTALYFFNCPKLTNIETLKEMKGLTKVTISQAPGLANIDALKKLKNLEYLVLRECTALTNVDALRELKALKTLSIHGCTGLKNVDGLLGLTGLTVIDLQRCAGLTKEAVAAVKAALPKTDIPTPDSETFTLDSKSDTLDKK